MSLWPAVNGPELLVNGVNSGAALSYNHPLEHIREDFGTTRMDYSLSDRDSLTGAYTIDDGDSLIPAADPLFASYSTLRSQVASLQETHILSPSMINTFRFGFSRAGYALDPVSLASFDPSLSFVTGQGPGGFTIGGGNTTTGSAALTAAGPNNAANVWNRRNLFTFSDGMQIDQGKASDQLRRVVSASAGQRETASRTTGVAAFASLATFLAGTVTTFQVVPDPNELGWRSLFGAAYVEDTIRLRRNLTLDLGLRDEFTTGWNEESGRAANYITDSTGVLLTAPLVGNSVFTQNNATHLFAPRVGLAWDPFGNGKTAVRAGFGTYYSLIDDLSFLLNALPPANGSASYAGALLPLLPVTPGVLPPPSCGPGVAPALYDLCAAGSPAQRANADGGGMEFQDRTAVEPEHGPADRLCRDHMATTGCSASIPTPFRRRFARPRPARRAATAPRRARCLRARCTYRYRRHVPNHYLGAGFFWYTEGNSSYNALQIDLTKRLSRGLQVRGNFTWSKNLDMNSAPTGAQANNEAQMIEDRNNLPLDWGPSALNVTGASQHFGHL